MDESGIEATQAMTFDDEFEDAIDEDNDKPIAYLKVPLQKGFQGKEYQLFEGDNVIGRDVGCKVCIPLKALSREHACIEIRGDSHFIYDKGSRNRTRRNKHFLAASVRYELKDNDELIFGDVQCTYTLTHQGGEGDDSDETGSESMFQTAPGDEGLGDNDENKDKPPDKLPDDEDGLDSDASSDILQPTQPTAGHIQSMLSKTAYGNAALAQNITVKETPAAPRTKRMMEDIVLPESDSEAESSSLNPLPTLAVADSDEDDSAATSKLLGAPTQAFVDDSDATTDDESIDERRKRSLLTAPTQAFVDDSISSEDSPAKRSLMVAATQAYNSDSAGEKTPVKRRIIAADTQAYDMATGIEPTVAYDMEEADKTETPVKRRIMAAKTQANDMATGIEPTVAYDMEEAEKTESEESEKNKSLMFQPTQAFVKDAVDGKVDDDGGESDTSEEFVLEGDTDTEDNPNDSSIMVAQTVPCDFGETQAIDTVDDDATCGVEDHKGAADQTVAITDETVAITDDSTQVIENDNTHRPGLRLDDATQEFDDVDSVRANKSHKFTSEDATQVIDNEAVTVDDQTQVFELDDSGKDKVGKKKTIAQNTDSPKKDNIQEADTTIPETQTFSDDDVEFDFISGATLAPVCDTDDIKEEFRTSLATANDATQAFDNIDGTVAVSCDDATQAVGCDDRTQAVCNGDKTQAVGPDDATQVIDCDGPTQAIPCNDKAQAVGPDDVTQAVNCDDATQAVGPDDATQAIMEDATIAVSDIGPSKKRIAADDATQVIDDTTVMNDHLGDAATQVITDETIPVTEDSGAPDATQVFDDATMEIKEPDVSRKRTVVKKKAIVDSEAATQVFDATVAIEDVETDEDIPKAVPKHKANAVDSETATQVFNEDEINEEPEKKKKATASNKTKSKRGKKESEKEVPLAEKETEERNLIDKKHEESDKKTDKVDENVAEVKETGKRSSRRKTEPADIGKVEDKADDKKQTRTSNRRVRKTADSGRTENKEMDETNVIEEKDQIRCDGRRGKKAEPEERVDVTVDKTKKTGRGKASPVKSVGTEEATQAYADSSDNEGMATQRYGDDDDDATPELSEIESESLPQAVPEIVVSPSKSPLKSALASPKKSGRSSPSPKKVMFVTQSSNSSSESSQTSRRSGRSKKKPAKLREEEVEAEKPETKSSTRRSRGRNRDATEDKMETTEHESVADDGETELENTADTKRKSRRGGVKIASTTQGSSEKKSEKAEVDDSEKVEKGSKETETGESIEVNKGNNKTDISESKEDKKGGKKAEANEPKEVTRGGRRSRKSEVVNETKLEVNEEVNEETDQTAKGGRSKRGKRTTETASAKESENKSEQETIVKSAKEEEKVENEIDEGKSTRHSKRGKKNEVKAEPENDDEVNEKNEPENKRVSRRGKAVVGKSDNETNDKETKENKESEKRSGSRRGRGKKVSDEVEMANEKDGKVKNDTTKESEATKSGPSGKSGRSRETADEPNNEKNLEVDKLDEKSDESKTVGKRLTRNKLGIKDEKDNDSDSVKGVQTTRSKRGRGKNMKDAVNEGEDNDKDTTAVKDERKVEEKVPPRSKRRGATNTGTKDNEKDTKATEKDSKVVENVASRSRRRGAVEKTETEKGNSQGSDSSKTDDLEKLDKHSDKTSDKKSSRKAATKIEKAIKEEEETDTTATSKRVSRLKRKGSDSSSADSQESQPEQQKKRQKTDITSTPMSDKKTKHHTDSPKQTGRRVSLMGTPKNTGGAGDVTHSPSLRKTTLDGNKAKVMFTGVVDEHGEKIVKELGGELATSITECTHLVTDQVRRTVKFLCGLSRGIHIVTPQWLESSKNSGLFSDPTPFLISDDASEKKFKFSLHLSLQKASEKPLYSDYKIHVTKSVKPEPQQMKDILTSAGAQYLSTMPKTYSENVVVVSTVDDKPACEAAIKAGIPVVNSEFVLTGILRQEIDVNSYLLFGNSSKRTTTSAEVESTSKRRKR